MPKNEMQSNIYMLPNSEYKPGICFICEEEKFLKFKDVSSDKKIGECCLRHALDAENALHNAGFRPLINNGKASR